MRKFLLNLGIAILLGIATGQAVAWTTYYLAGR